MAFLRKHRARYWLVHNFRVDGKVQQVRLYPFDLHEDLDGEIARAQSAVASCHQGQIAPTWIASVRQQLQHLQDARQGQYRERQVQRLHEQMADVVQTLDLLPVPPQEKHQLIQACIVQLQGRLAQENTDATLASMPKTAHPPDAPRQEALHAAGAPVRTIEVGKGFYLRDRSLYHACMEEPPLCDDTGPGWTGNHQQALSPVAWVSLIQGRDLWLECQSCHARWHNLSQVTQYTCLKLHRQKISKFDRFCWNPT